MTLQLHSIDHISSGAAETNALSELDQRAASGMYGTVWKRALDLGLVCISLPVVVPVIAIMALCVILQGNRPFFLQDRIGRDGKIFRIWKIRTMVENADELLERHLQSDPLIRQEWNHTQKLKNDPRITPVGRVLRKTSLDELPQLWNVLNGSMSLVGPRPMMPIQEEYYYGTAYYRIRPGITGYWQIADRNNCSFVRRIAYDEAYYRTLSFKTDLVILKNTVRVVLNATGH